MLDDIIRACIKNQFPCPLIIAGPPGVGKTARVRAVASELATPVIDIRLSQYDAVDLRGLPRLDGDCVRWVPPSVLPRQGNGVLFFDELGQAAEDVQAAAMQLLHDRKLGDYCLPNGWAIIAATNRSEDQAASNALIAPLLNRCCYVQLSPPTADEWIAWASEALPPTRSRDIVIGYLRDRPTVIYDYSPERYGPFASPRSWEFVSRLPENLITMPYVVCGLIGSIGESLCSYAQKIMRRSNTQSIEWTPEFVSNCKSASMLPIIAEGLAAKSLPRETKIKILAALSPEYAAIAIKRLASADPQILSDPQVVRILGSL